MEFVAFNCLGWMSVARESSPTVRECVGLHSSRAGARGIKNMRGPLLRKLKRFKIRLRRYS